MGDILQFGQSTRLYVVSGPEVLGRPEVEDEKLEAYRTERAKVRAWREARRRKKEGLAAGQGPEEAGEDEEQTDGLSLAWRPARFTRAGQCPPNSGQSVYISPCIWDALSLNITVTYTRFPPTDKCPAM